MPYKLRKAPKRDLYWVVNTETKQKHSKDPLPKERAEAQMRALYAAESKEGKGKTPPPKEPAKEAPKAPERPADKRPPRQIPAHLLAPLQLEAPPAAAQGAPVMGGPGSAFTRKGKGKQSGLAQALGKKSVMLSKAADLRAQADAEPGLMSINKIIAARDLREDAAKIARALPAIADDGKPYSGKKAAARVSPLGPAIKKVAGSPIKAARLLQTPQGKQQVARLGKGKAPSDSSWLRKRFPFRTLSMTNLYREWNNARQESMLKSMELKRFEELVAEYRRSGYRQMPVQNQKIIRKQQELDEAVKRFRQLQKEIERRGDVDIPETVEEGEEEDELEGQGNPKYWIGKVISSKSFKKGAFTKQALAHDMTPKEFAKEVIAHPEDYTLTTRRRAQFLMNILPKDKVGSGFFTNLYDTIKKSVSGAVNLATKGIRKGYSPSAKRMLDEYASGQIVELAVRRDPIQAFLDVALNAITLGKWSQAKRDLHYDKLFHLGLVVGVKKNGRRTNLIVEKNEVINIATAKRPVAGTEFFHIPLRGKQMTFGEFMDNAEQAKGTEFFLYDAFENNCQDFVMGLLKANGLLDENAATFIKQPVDQLVRKLPSFTQTVARKITDLGAAANVVLEGQGLKGLLDGAGVGHIFETRFNPKTGFFHRPFEPMSGAGPLFFLKGRGSDRGRYYIRPDLTIPDLANFLNEMTAPNEIAGVLAKLESPTEMGAQNQGRTNYNFYRDYEAQAMETADNLEKLVNEQYDQSMEMLNAFRSQKPQGLGALVNAIGQGIAVFRTLKGISSPIGALKFGAESLGSLLNAAFSGDLYRVAPQTSYSYSQQLQGELSSILGPAGQVGAQIAGTLGELFGAKSQAERNDPYVESVIRAKRDEALPLIQQFRQRWQDNLRATKSQEERMDVADAANRREGDLRHQYEKEVFWMDRLSPADWSDRFEGEARPADRPYVSFDSWKAKKGYGREPVIKMKKKDFIAEHKKLIALLEKVCSEGKEQAAELASMTGGGTHRENFLKANKLADKSYSLAQLAKISAVPKAILQEVYNRGVGAHRTSPQSVRLKGSFVKNVDAPMSKKLSKEQWGMARVYSFLDGNPKHDEDLRRNGSLVGGQPTDNGLPPIDKARINQTAGDAIRNYPGNTRTILELRDKALAEIDAGDNARDAFNRFFDRIAMIPGVKRTTLLLMMSHYKSPKAAAKMRLRPAAAPAAAAAAAPAPEPAARPRKIKKEFAPQLTRGGAKGIIFRSLEKSNIAGKKWRVNLTVDGRSRTIHFGAAGMDDFTKTNDKAQKKRYIDRHKAREDWTKKGILSAGFWSRWILWNKPSVADSLADVRKRFKF